MPEPLSPLVADYPADATGDAEVVLEVVVDTTGHVQDARVLAGAEPFSTQAINAARSWRFDPARRGNEPIAVRIRVTVAFEEPERAAENPRPLESPRPPAKSTLAAVPPRASPGAHSGASPQSEPSTILPSETGAEIASEVVVQGVRAENTSMTFSREEVRRLPGAFGDPFRALEMMPGVTPTTSGFPYFYVRGAPPANVGAFFDDVPLPALYHANIGPSLLHPAFIESVSLYPGGYSARYGRYAGGVVAGQLAAPARRFRGETSVRLFDAGLMLEVPFARDRGTVMVGGRYSYSGAILSFLSPDIEISYWDYQARGEYDFGGGRLGLLVFGAHDFLSLDRDAAVDTVYDTTFHRGDVRYDFRLGAASTLRVAGSWGYDVGEGPMEDVRVRSRQGRVRTMWVNRAAPDLLIRAGADAQLERFDYWNTAPLTAHQRRDFERTGGNHDFITTGFWAELVSGGGREPILTPGVRFDVYHDSGATRFAVEPRLSLRYPVSNTVLLTYAIGISHQPPSFERPTPGYRPRLRGPLQLGVQSSAGVELRLPADIGASVTVFQNLLFEGMDVRGVDALSRGEPELSEDARVLGRSIGAEFSLSRSLTRDLGGFLSYTVSRADLRLGRTQGPSGYDRTHVLSGALAYELGRGFRTGVRGSFYTGIPARVGLPEAMRRPPRTAPYYRVDVRGEKRWMLGQSGAWCAVVLEMLNSTLQKEALSSSCYAYGCKDEEIGPVVLPSVGVEAAF